VPGHVLRWIDCTGPKPARTFPCIYVHYSFDACTQASNVTASRMSPVHLGTETECTARQLVRTVVCTVMRTNTRHFTPTWRSSGPGLPSCTGVPDGRFARLLSGLSPNPGSICQWVLCAHFEQVSVRTIWHLLALSPPLRSSNQCKLPVFTCTQCPYSQGVLRGHFCQFLIALVSRLRPGVDRIPRRFPSRLITQFRHCRAPAAPL
jgi:hypothetical protein